MADLDEISRAIGQLEGKVDALQEGIRASREETANIHKIHWNKLNEIEKYIAHHKGWIAGIAASVSLVVTIVVWVLKDLIKK